MAGPGTIRIGGASGYWGESDMAMPQLLADGGLDYIVFDYLAEITMSIMARARAKSPDAGYATDFVAGVVKPHLKEIAEQGVTLIANAGGVNPVACAEAVRAVIAEAGLDLKVGVVLGDDLLDRAGELANAGHTEMFTGEAFPAPDGLASINAYLGAFPIADALGRGADIVITGRCVDSAVTLGACIHAFGWTRDDLDKLAQGSLAGHIIECGPQATGGNFTDWQDVAETLADVGYPIAEISADGAVEITKPTSTGGLVSAGTVGEQMLYEIGDPQAYMLPDVVCDFSTVQLEQTGENRVRLTGATGQPAPDTYKVCATYADGWRGGAVWFYYGEDAPARAETFAKMGIDRARKKLRSMNAPDYTETLVELVGDDREYGAYAPTPASRSVAVKVAAKHEDARAIGLLLKEITGTALAAPPGLSGFAGGRSKPSPVFRLFSFALPKSDVSITVEVEGETRALEAETGQPFDPVTLERATPPATPADETLTEVPLVRLAFARSGDKGNKANIGILPRDPAYAPWIWAALTEDEITRRFAHYLDGDVERFYLPGTGAMNILLDEVLGGGGVASLRNDPQGKGYSQLLLAAPIPIPRTLAEAL